ncbi:MAG: FAD-binding protein [Deltaproteobacteria bacterium]|nr:FAD-binding protein [Deltaproteobacteria bacterium]
MQRRVIETDVLVVGGGGAGFRAAIGAREKDVEVMLLSKGPLARCGATPMAGADFTLDGRSMSEIEGLTGDPEDTPEKVFNDIVTQGCYLNNQKLVEQYVRTAPRCLKELIDWGIKIKLSDQRMIFTTGIGIMDALLRKARSARVVTLDDMVLLDLVTQGGRVTGALGLDIRTGEFVRLQARAVVMATGGWHKAFWPNTGMRDLSGDGTAMAHRAGAKLGNMEFITFCCNVFYSPPIWRGSLAPYLISLTCGGRLTNNLGHDILEEYDAGMVQIGTATEWNKSFISHATMKEVRRGNGTASGGVYYSRGDVPWENVELVASVLFPKWKYKAIDLSDWGRMLEANEPVEVGPAVEYFDGGIVVNDRFETSVPGLFAAGECTLGPFGANRVFAAITEMLAHGADAGANAADYARQSQLTPVDESLLDGLQEESERPLIRKDGPRPQQLRRRVQEAAHRCLGPIRNQGELNELVDILEDVKQDELPKLATTSKSRIYNKEWIDALELTNIVQLLEITAHSALARTESRGVHYREDFPQTDNDEWLKESVVLRAGEGFEVAHRPLTVTSMTPPAGVTPYLDFVKQMMDAHSDTGGKH